MKSSLKTAALCLLGVLVFACGSPRPALAKVYDVRQRMDLVLTVGAYNMLAKALHSFGAQLEDTMEGFPDS